MSKYSHRTVKELKTFIKKYNEHFRIMLTGKKKSDLVEEIEEGMKKTVTQDLRNAHNELLSKTPKPKKPKVEKPKEKPKPKKEDEVRPAKKPFPPIPKNIRGKRVNVKFGKPPTKERIETGKINVGKVDKTKPKVKSIKIKKEKKVKKPTGQKVKKAVEKIEKKDKSSCHFDKKYLNVPSDYVEGGNILYIDPTKNIKLEFFTKNPDVAPDTIRLDLMTSRFNSSKDPAPKGATREALCGVLQELVNRKIVTKNGTIDLIAGKVQVKGVKHSIKKLKQMYQSMGFKKADGFNTFEQKIGDLMKWCKSNYPDCIE